MKMYRGWNCRYSAGISCSFIKYDWYLEPLNRENVKGEGRKGGTWNNAEILGKQLAMQKKINRMQKCKQNKTPYIPVGITYQTN